MRQLSMKRIVLLICLVLGLAIPMGAPAQAIFGLGKCEKVKSEVLNLERQIIDIAKKGRGYNYEQIVFKQKSTIWEPTKATVNMVKKLINNDPIPKIWKLGTNNPKCFTNTQKMQIKKMQGYSYQNYLTYPSTKFKYINTGECKTLMENNDYTYDWTAISPDEKTLRINAKCSLGNVNTISFKEIYTSIYEY
jgi:hypothetical protein